MPQLMAARTKVASATMAPAVSALAAAALASALAAAMTATRNRLTVAAFSPSMAEAWEICLSSPQTVWKEMRRLHI